MSKGNLAIVAAAMLLGGGCYEREGMGVAETGTDTDAVGSSSGGGESGGVSGGTTAAADGTTGGAETTGGESSGAESSSDAGDTTGEGPESEDELDQLIANLCGWDFECCDDGEVDYRLGPFTTDAADCTERYVEQLHSNDDLAETPRGDLLYVLGFAVRLDRSTPNDDAVVACRELLDDRECSQPPGDEAFCEPADAGVDNPCDLRSLFTGTQEIGDACSGALASLGYDIECQPGASCEEVDNVFVCVDKGLDGDFCEADHTCDQGLFCDLSEGRCAPRRALGESCAFEDALEPDPGTETLPCLEHLTCDPGSDTCVQFCSEGYDCGDDSACAQGDSCIPVDVGDNTYTYCQERGTTNGDRCDSDRDCADGLHCNGDACVTDRALGLSCAGDNECQAGLYCDLAVSGNCEVVANANALCAADRECNPSTTLGCMTSDDGQRCRTMMLDDGDDCTPGERAGSVTGNWCSSGVCEDITDDGLSNPECHGGADVGDECDSAAGTTDVHRCRVGTYCVDSECRAKQPAGGDCEDDGAQQCLNGSCADVWQGDYCTDAAPLGDNTVATCDGQD